MKTRQLFTIAATALFFAACSEQDGLEQAELTNGNPQTSGNAVVFDTYMSNPTATRSGSPGAIDTDRLKQSGYGFGVFAYKTGTSNYADYRTQNAVTRRYPNFMYNEHIRYDAVQAKWVYDNPQNTKYWPNEVHDFWGDNVDDQNNDSANDPATTDYTNGGLVSFFAYAPYVPESDKVTTPAIAGQTVRDVPTVFEGGILTYSTPSFNGGTPTATATEERYKFSDPYVGYKIAQESSKQVDLLWATTLGSSESVLNQGMQLGNSAELLPEFTTYGLEIKNDYVTDPLHPFYLRPTYNVPTDLTKQKTNGTVNLHFKHALAKVGGAYHGTGDGSDEDPSTPTNGLMIILDVDKDEHETGGSLYPYAGTITPQTPYNTKVTVNEIVLQSEKQLTQLGMHDIKENIAFDYSNDAQAEPLFNTGLLNLATGVWHDVRYLPYDNGQTVRTQTILSPGAPFDGTTDDGSKDAVLHPNIAEPTAYATQPYTRERYEELPIGVTTIAKNVYKSNTQPFVFIPGTYPIITITVDYTVRTFDAKLADNYSEVRQRITKRLCILDQILLNKQYNILIHLGLTSVKFTATVSDWDVTDAHVGSTTDPGDGQSVVQTYDQDVEHVYLPINVADIDHCSLTSIADFPATGALSRDLGVVTFFYADGAERTSHLEGMTFTLTPTMEGAAVTVDCDEASPTYGHVTITLPPNNTTAARNFNLAIHYGYYTFNVPFIQRAPEP